FSKENRAWWLLAASVVLCISVLIWYFSGSASLPETAAADTGSGGGFPVAELSGQDTARQRPASSIIENQMIENSMDNGAGAYRA
ncbi:hypothetical protein OFN94_36925, partial [Escherichia coli]|nr:hypothetical protein [Escherichia coli]